MKTGFYQRPDSAEAVPAARRVLLLMRHAKSAWPDVPDRDRPLAARGRRDAPLMGRWLRTAGYAPDRVVCSTALRASQMWQEIYVRDAALRSVLAIEDARSLGPWLEELARSAPFTVRTTAQQALQEACHA